jgi:hypothetical protein
MIVDALVEGPPDAAVARQLIRHCGHEFGVAFGKQGLGFIRAKIAGFNVRARYGNPILALVDAMDTGARCPPEILAAWLPERSPKLLLRAVVPELESWLIADRAGLAAWLGIAVATIPPEPERLSDPKQALVNLARRSRHARLREALAPPQGSSHSVGPGYASLIEEFVLRRWNITGATERADSLRRCIQRLRELEP